MKVMLYRKNDVVFADADGREDMAVKVVWLRPATGWGKEVSLLGKKEEFLQLNSLDELDPESRKIAQEEMSKFYLMPEIKSIVHTEVHFGNRYWDVETNMGRRRFAMKNPYVNIRWVDKDEVFIRDVIGNIFHISSFLALDEESRAEYDKIT